MGWNTFLIGHIAPTSPEMFLLNATFKAFIKPSILKDNNLHWTE